MSASARLSVRLQDIAQSLAEVLDEVAGEPIAFVLVLQADKAAQYVSNCDRKDGRELIESLLARWKAGRADIPAHMNPDLRPPQAGQRSNSAAPTQAAQHLLQDTDRKLFDALARDPNARQHARDSAEAIKDAQAAAELVEALRWYGEQARLARLIHSEGDAGRHALAADGGEKARAALSRAPGTTVTPDQLQAIKQFMEFGQERQAAYFCPGGWAYEQLKPLVKP